MRPGNPVVWAGALLAALTACTTAEPSAEPLPTVEESTMLLTSPAFADGETIPVRFTCDGDDVSPPLELTGIPDGATSLVLVMDDPDAPRGTWDHWVAFDIPVVSSIPEDVGPLGVPGENSWGRAGYGGPCPPSGTHRYVFRVYALADDLGLSEGSSKAEVLAAIGDDLLADAGLTGLYGR